MRLDRLRRDWPYLCVALAALTLFAPFLLGQQVMYWGTPLLQFYPWRKFALETVRAGHLPLWNPYLGNGAPLVANYQSAVFYPPNWISFVLPLDHAMGWLVALHLIWAGAGMVTLARSLGLRPIGQAVAGLAFGLSQYLVARAGFFSINATAAWVPWVIWAGEGLILSTRRQPSPGGLKHSLLLSLFLALQLLAGHAQITWYTLLLLWAWSLWRLLRPDPDSQFLIRHTTIVIAHLSFASAFAFLLAALQLLPTAELLRQSPRATAADYEFVMTYSFSPWRLLTLLAPDLLGNPAHGRYYGYGNYWEDAIYVGVLPLLLAAGVVLQALASLVKRQASLPPASDPVLVQDSRPDATTPQSSFAIPNSPLATPNSLFATPHSPIAIPNSQLPTPHSSLVVFLSLLLPLALILALGRNTPIFPLFYKYVPTFNLFQAPARMMIWFVFALALLAGLGADRWRRPQGRALYWTRLGAAGAVAVAVVGLLAVVAIPGTGQLAQQLHTVARALAPAGVGLFASAALSLLRPKADAPALGGPDSQSLLYAHTVLPWELAVALFLCADLIFAGYGLNPGAPPDLYRAPTASGAALAPALAGHRLFQFPDDEYHAKYDLYYSFLSFGPPEYARATREAQLPNVALLDGLASANNFEPLVSARYLSYLDVVSATRSLNLLRLMDVGALASTTPLNLEPMTRGGGTTFYRVPGEVRRVWVTDSARLVADAEAARAAIAASDFDPGSVVVLEADDPGVYAAHPLFDSLTGSPDVVTIPVSLHRPGWVVLADAYYPGWVAFVDGQPATLLHADYAFRAVAVGAGEHTVTFRYEPRSFQVGWWLSSMGWLLWIGAVLWAQRLKA